MPQQAQDHGRAHSEHEEDQPEARRRRMASKTQREWRALAQERIEAYRPPAILQEFARAEYDASEPDSTGETSEYAEPSSESSESPSSDESESEGDEESLAGTDDSPTSLQQELRDLKPRHLVGDEWKEEGRLRFELIELLDAEELDKLELVLDARIPGPISLRTLERIDEVHASTQAYREDDVANWEVVIEKKHLGIASLLNPVLDQPEDPKVTQDVIEALGGYGYKMVRQFPGGGRDIIGEVVVKTLNAVKGGFCFLAGAGLKADFLEILVHLSPFFQSGGRMLLVAPISEIGNGILTHLRAWRETCESASANGGGFRFVFVTDYENESSYPKELVVAFPGRNLVKSAENAEFMLLNLDVNDHAIPYLEALDQYYIELGTGGRIVYGVPAVEEIYDLAHEEQEVLEYDRARAKIVNGVSSKLKGSRAQRVIAEIKAGHQVTIGMAVSGEVVGPRQDQEVDSDEDDEPLRDASADFEPEQSPMAEDRAVIKARALQDLQAELVELGRVVQIFIAAAGFKELEDDSAAEDDDASSTKV
ncbi:hypothetical protein JCM3774_004250 [Rhodotorula dairenensis]